MQMLAYSTFILFIGITLRRECLQRHLSNSVIIVVSAYINLHIKLIHEYTPVFFGYEILDVTIAMQFVMRVMT